MPEFPTPVSKSANFAQVVNGDTLVANGGNKSYDIDVSNFRLLVVYASLGDGTTPATAAGDFGSWINPLDFSGAGYFGNFFTIPALGNPPSNNPIVSGRAMRINHYEVSMYRKVRLAFTNANTTTALPLNVWTYGS